MKGGLWIVAQWMGPEQVSDGHHRCSHHRSRNPDRNRLP